MAAHPANCDLANLLKIDSITFYETKKLKFILEKDWKFMIEEKVNEIHQKEDLAGQRLIAVYHLWVLTMTNLID